MVLEGPESAASFLGPELITGGPVEVVASCLSVGLALDYLDGPPRKQSRVA